MNQTLLLIAKDVIRSYDQQKKHEFYNSMIVEGGENFTILFTHFPSFVQDIEINSNLSIITLDKLIKFQSFWKNSTDQVKILAITILRNSLHG